MDSALRSTEAGINSPGNASTAPVWGSFRLERNSPAMTPATQTPETEAPAESTPEIAEEAPTVVETSPAEGQTPSALFRYSAFVHVGPGADGCEDGEDGACGDPLHFHAWCRLPNQFQHSSIREKALAAKARRQRQLRDSATDVFDILEAELDGIAREGEAGKSALVEELLQKDFWRDHMEATQAVQEDEQFATIDEDLERYRALEATPEGERNADEHGELKRHIDSYEEAATAEREKVQTPRREALEALDINSLIDQVREERIEIESNEEFMRTYSLWEMFIGTMKPRDKEKGLPNERVFGDINHLKDAAAPEVVEALDVAFRELASAQQRGGLGNS